MSTTAGYSGTPLAKKLGIKTGMKLLLIKAPADYFDWMEQKISKQLCTKNEVPDFIHLFVKNKSEFETGMKQLKSIVQKKEQIILWISWYKKSAKMNSDITEDDIRAYALQNGLVDVKVCAVSEIWSGLKLVVPVALRSKK